MEGQNTSNLSDVLEEDYKPALRKQITEKVLLLDKLNATSNGVTETIAGMHAVLALQVGRNTSAASRGEDEDLPAPGRRRYKRAVIDLKYHYASGRITGPAMARTKGANGSYVDGLDSEIEGIEESMTHEFGRQAWGAEHGIIGFIDASVTGAGTEVSPFVTHISDVRAFIADWFEEEQLVQLVTLDTDSGEADLVGSPADVLRIVDVDEDAQHVFMVIESGSPAPANGNGLVKAGSANRCMAGLSQIISDETSVFEGVDPTRVRLWKAIRDGNGGTKRAFSINLLKQHHNRLARRGGKKADLVITSQGIERQAYDELKAGVRYNDPNSLTVGSGVKLDDSTTLYGDPQAPKGSVFSINTKSIRLYQAGDGDWLKQDGSNLLRMENRDAVRFTWFQYCNWGCDQRNANGELYDLTDNTRY